MNIKSLAQTFHRPLSLPTFLRDSQETVASCLPLQSRPFLRSTLCWKDNEALLRFYSNSLLEWPSPSSNFNRGWIWGDFCGNLRAATQTTNQFNQKPFLLNYRDIIIYFLLLADFTNNGFKCSSSK